MEKIENALENNENLVQEAVDDVAEMNDTLNTKMSEVDDELANTIESVNNSLHDTTENINQTVNERIGRMSTFVLAKKMQVEADTYNFGGENGVLIFPLNSLSAIDGLNYKTDVIGWDGNRIVWYQGGTATSRESFKLDFHCGVEGMGESFNVGDEVNVKLVTFLGNATNVVQEINVPVQQNNFSIDLSSIFIMAAMTTRMYIVLNSASPKQLSGEDAFITIEKLGMDN